MGIKTDRGYHPQRVGNNPSWLVLGSPTSQDHILMAVGRQLGSSSNSKPERQQCSRLECNDQQAGHPLGVLLVVTMRVRQGRVVTSHQ